MEILRQNQEWFNLINYSVLLNVLSGLNSSEPKNQSRKFESKKTPNYDSNLDLTKKSEQGWDRGATNPFKQKVQFLDKDDFEFLTSNLTKRLQDFSDEITARKLSNIIYYLAKLITTP